MRVINNLNHNKQVNPVILSEAVNIIVQDDIFDIEQIKTVFYIISVIN